MGYQQNKLNYIYLNCFFEYVVASIFIRYLLLDFISTVTLKCFIVDN
jgi:hypothetical protein